MTAVEFRVREPAEPREVRPDLGIRGAVAPIPLEKRFPSVFLKFAMRNSFDFALASVAVFLDRDGRRVHRCHIALGGVAATPYRPREAEQVVAGNLLTNEVIHAAGRAAVKDAKPLEMNARIGARGADGRAGAGTRPADRSDACQWCRANVMRLRRQLGSR